ncbi:hypothetical protein GC722_02790 [Auraticoccus sp. F435]|uniref:Uncharacterized protein n=1 Tax=Auraticoccus cholistanensis TaxID=2656650 RepID=A0A6A9V080_9ACTN|nr:hypothetical protein [Auraticoccus cholistanensis]MVA74960.1 hypothetical protein [Auraticoccus cholistanensis]
MSAARRRLAGQDQPRPGARVRRWGLWAAAGAVTALALGFLAGLARPRPPRAR